MTDISGPLQVCSATGLSMYLYMDAVWTVVSDFVIAGFYFCFTEPCCDRLHPLELVGMRSGWGHVETCFELRRRIRGKCVGIVYELFESKLLLCKERRMKDNHEKVWKRPWPKYSRAK